MFTIAILIVLYLLISVITMHLVIELIKHFNSLEKFDVTDALVAGFIWPVFWLLVIFFLFYRLVFKKDV